MLKRIRGLCCSQSPPEVFVEFALLQREDQLSPISTSEYYPINILRNFYLDFGIDINQGIIIKSYDFLYILPEKAPLPENILAVNEKYHIKIRTNDRAESSGSAKYYLSDLSLFEP